MKKQQSNKEIQSIKTTLKARIIPNLPLTPESIREDARTVIDNFEFDYYFKEFEQKIKELELNSKNRLMRIKELDELLERKESTIIERIDKRIENLETKFDDIPFARTISETKHYNKMIELLQSLKKEVK